MMNNKRPAQNVLWKRVYLICQGLDHELNVRADPDSAPTVVVTLDRKGPTIGRNSLVIYFSTLDSPCSKFTTTRSPIISEGP